MIGYEQALAELLHGLRPLPVERVSVAEAPGRLLARDLGSPAALPRFDNAAMDGYALAAGHGPLPAGTELIVAGSLAAGEIPEDATSADGRAWEIMTGAALPAGLDTVVPLEQVETLAADPAAGTRIRLREGIDAGRHIRRRGEDLAEGGLAIAGGRCLQAADLMLLAALGIEDVPAVRRPRVAIIATGRELAGTGDACAPAQIHDSNTPFLHARLRAGGAEVVARERVGDDVGGFHAALERALARDPDLVISSGAVSQGRYDFVPAALRARGARIGFHGVRIRPGKPLLHARLDEGPIYFGLPGNPLSCAVGLRFFVEPALRAMLGLAPERALRLPLEEGVWKRSGLRTHLHARLHCGNDGKMRVRVLPRQESFRLLPFQSSQAWAVLPEAGDSVAAGATVDVYGLGHLQAPAWDMDT